MEPEPTNPQVRQDRELNQALERDEELDGLSLQHERLARIQEYEELALARSDPFAALLGTSHLAQLFEHLGKAVLDELQTQPPTLTAIRDVAPEFRLLLKLRSAIETDLEFQHHVIGKQPMALPGTTRKGTLDKQAAVHNQRGLVSRHRRSNAWLWNRVGRHSMENIWQVESAARSS